MNSVRIGSRIIGGDAPVYVVAEVSANHNQNFERAIKIIQTAKECGADAVKLQTYTADTLTIDSDQEWFRVPGQTPWQGKTLHELYKEAFTPWEWHADLQAAARKLGLELFSSPFDATAVDFLEHLDMPAYKIASFELVDLPLLKRVAQTGKPVILSTGMASLEEIREAVATLRDHGTHEIVLLKCTSAYPARPDEMNLRTIPHLAQTFGVPVGLSDHSMGLNVAVAAVTLGAKVVEKHLTLRRSDGGADSSFSMEPGEFAQMVHAIREVEQALGTASFSRSTQEQNTATFRRSLFVVEDIRKGQPFTTANVRSIRPGHGLHTRYLEQVLGKKAACDIARGTPVKWDLVEP